MKISAARLSTLAGDTGFLPETLEKVVRLGEVLADIGRHPLLSKVLALKGGTALNFFFGPPQRMSVDLDFNYVGHVDRAKMLADRPDVESAIERIAKGQGYTVQRSKEAHAGRKFYLAYTAVTGTQDRIEVDINYLFRIPLGDIQQLSMWQPEGVDRPRATIVPLEELFAGKLRATLDRMMPRDLFDTVRLPDHGTQVWGTPKLRSIFVALAGTLPHPVYTYDNSRLDQVTDRIIEEQLRPMLNSSTTVSTGTLKADAWKVIAPLLELNENERKYIDRIHMGELQPELLFADDHDLCTRVRQHPALAWKVQNVKGNLVATS